MGFYPVTPKKLASRFFSWVSLRFLNDCSTVSGRLGKGRIGWATAEPFAREGSPFRFLIARDKREVTIRFLRKGSDSIVLRTLSVLILRFAGSLVFGNFRAVDDGQAMSAFVTKYQFVFDHIHNVGDELLRTNLDRLRSGGRVLDYGCGIGEVALRFAHEYPQAEVIGADAHDAFQTLSKRAEVAGVASKPDNLNFIKLADDASSVHAIAPSSSQISLDRLGDPDSIDVVYSWCVFEHIDRSVVQQCFDKIAAVLKPDGVFYFYINPLYFSSRGAHLYGALPEPWVHLLHEDETLRKQLYAAAERDPAIKADILWHQYVTLNKLTAFDFREMSLTAGLHIVGEHFGREGAPPESLARAYNFDALTTKDISLILAKSR